ncbi:MAG: DUF2163 domain-containing protein [Pseudomonas marincola]
MKTLTAQLQSHLQGEVTSLASCWYILRRDGEEVFLTDHDADLTFNGHLYRASDGYNRSALKGSSGTDTDEMDLSGCLNSDWLSENDLRAGIYDFAQIHFFLLNWQDVSMGSIPLRKGWIGEVSWSDGLFQAELRGLSNSFKRNLGKIYTPECTADLGDDRCMLDIEALASMDVIADTSSRNNFTLTNYDADDGELDGGIVHFMSGGNVGQKLEIQSWLNSGKQLTLFIAAPYEISVGDSITLYPGCDKRFSSCKERYANQMNFRGFPYVPGLDGLLEVQNA